MCLRVTSFFSPFLKISSPSANHRVSFIPSDGPLDVSYMDEDTGGYHDEVDDAIDTVLRRHEQQQQQQQQHGSSNHVYADHLYDDEENGIVIDDDEENVDCDDFSPEKKISKRHSTTGGESSTGVSSTGEEYSSQYHAAQHHQYSAPYHQQHHLPHGTQHSTSIFSTFSNNNKAPTPSKNSYSKPQPQPQYDDPEHNVNTYHYDRSAYEMGNERIDRDPLHSSRSLKGDRQAALKMVYGTSPSGGGKKKLGRSNSFHNENMRENRGGGGGGEGRRQGRGRGTRRVQSATGSRNKVIAKGTGSNTARGSDARSAEHFSGGVPSWISRS